MQWLALSLFVCTILFLIDKNQAWHAFWRFMKWSGVITLVLAIGLGGYYAYQQRHPHRMGQFSAADIDPPY